MAILVRPGGAQCDGDIPAWVTDDAGCAQPPAIWEYLWPPDHWFAPTRCIGMWLS